jgi:CxxC motif-containing protein (DUF1111 family)
VNRRVVALGLTALALGCGSASPPPAPPLDASERLPGGATTNTFLLGTDAFSLPAENATPEHERAFFSGNSFFNDNWVQAPASTTARDGLGPLFNARSCGSCHFKDGRGRPPLSEDEDFVGLLLRLSVPGGGEHGEPLPEPIYGGQLQPHAIDEIPAEGNPTVRYEPIPGEYADGDTYELLRPTYAIAELGSGPMQDDTQLSPRVAPAMIGLGLLEAIPLARLAELADPDDANEDGISGRLNQVWDVRLGELAAGRFGWKAEQPTVLQQSAAAFNGDIGITSSLFLAGDCRPTEPCSEAPSGGEPEIDDALLERVGLYGRLLAVPLRTRWKGAEIEAGRDLFHELGCASCHTPSHTTGAYAELPELENQRIWPYTDLLLHDLGDELGDHRPSFAAEGNEWRTPPLWGLRLYPTVNDHDRLLHDGRARGVAEAILWHGGEAEAAREGFRTLDRDERALLIGFVESL